VEGRRAEAVVTVIGAGLAVFAALFYVLGIVGSPPDEEAATKAGFATAFAAVPAPSTSTTALEVADLTDAVTQALAENGFTEVVGESALSAELPTSVVKVLIANDAVLRVAEESSEPQNGAGR
jgi:hypothetical protein